MKFKVYATHSVKDEADKFGKKLIVVNRESNDWENYFEIEINTIEELLEFKEKANDEIVLLEDGSLEIYNACRE